MSKATLTLKSPAPVSKLDRTDRTRELWTLAYRQSHSMIRDGGQYGYGARYVWALDHMRRRFGPAGWPVCQQAARVAFDLRAVSKAATGTAEELARQGMLTRCVRLEKAPRGGWSWAWTHDPLAAVNLNRSYRVYLARQRRAVARAMAEDRLVMAVGPVEERFALTVTGLLALRAAEAATA